MSWPEGLTLTEGHWEDVTAPLDKRYMVIEPRYAWVETKGTLRTIMHAHGGPFYYNPRLFGLIYIYWGFKPTATWPAGFGDEGLLPFVSRWLKKKDWGNLAILPTIRRAK